MTSSSERDRDVGDVREICWMWVDGAKAVVGERREAARRRMERCILYVCCCCCRETMNDELDGR